MSRRLLTLGLLSLEAAIFELWLPENGLYPFVTHAFADATKGAVGVFQARTATGTMAH